MAARADATLPSRPKRTRAPLGPRILRAGLLFLSCALLLNVLVGANGLPALLQARHEYTGVVGNLDRVRAENARLRQEIRRLREDRDAIEELARRDLGFIAPGEKLFIIRDVAPPSNRPPQ
jgi:cell division protein FtsB